MRILPTSNFKQVSDLNEIIFANRNRAYGAYELRKHYHERLLKAFLITASSLLLIVLVVSYILNHKPPKLNGDWFPKHIDTVRTFTIEHRKKTPPSTPNHLRSVELPTSITSGSAVQNREKKDTTQFVASNNSSSHGDSTFHGENPEGTGLATDTLLKSDDDSFFQPVEVMPSFPGGNKAFTKYIQKHFYCDGATMSVDKSDGKIVLRFVILKNGSVDRIEVLKSNVSIDCVNRAKEMLMKSPLWSPGMNNNLPVNVQLVLPITVIRQ